MICFRLKREAIQVSRVWVCRIVLPLIFFYGCKSEDKRPLKTEQANWEKLGPGGGGATFIPTFSYHSTSEFLVKCDMTGSYLTRDGGHSYTQINFPNGASSFAFDPHSKTTIYIGSTFLNRSKDGGKTWENIFPKKEEISGSEFKGDHGSFSIKTVSSSLYNSESRHVDHVRVDPVRPNTLYFSMGKAFYYSNDDAETFRRVDLQYPVDFIYTNTSELKDNVLVFTSNIIYTFHKISGSVESRPLPVSIAPAFSFTGGTLKDSDKVILYALHYDQSRPIQEEFGHTELWTSYDNGLTWKQVNHQIINNATSGIKPSYSMVACAEFDAGQAYVVCNRYEEKRGDKTVHWYGALKTDDSGESWQWVWKGGGGSGQYGVKDGVGVTNLKDAWAENAFGREYIRLMDIGIDPANGNTAIVTDWYRTMKTKDGGKTWKEIYSETQLDGSFRSRGMDVTTAYGVHFDPFDNNHIAISYTDIGYHHSFNKGKSWKRSVEGIPGKWQNTCYWLVFDPKVKNKVWSAWSNLHDFPRGKMTRRPAWKERARGGVAVSADGGKTWQPSTGGDMGDNSATTCVVLDPASTPGDRTLYATVYNKGVFKSTDDGKTWALKNKGLDENTCAFEITITTNGTLFLVVSPTPAHKDGKEGSEFYPGAVYRSTDGADTWIKINISDKAVIFPNGIEYDPKKPERVYLACWSDITLSDLVGRAGAKKTDGDVMLKSEGGIFKSEDNGATWISILDRSIYVYDVTVDTNHKGRIYCNSFNQAAYRSDDYGSTWKKLKGYDFHWGQRIIVDQFDPEQVYITTFGSSVWHGIPVVE